MKQLRPYQKETLDALLHELNANVDPVVVNASVGAGKSLIIAELLKSLENEGFRALCLTLNSELIRQNVKAYRVQGGHASIFCAALHEKDLTAPVIFASPHSIHMGLKSNAELKKIRFNLIVIDECHNVNTNDKKSMYIRLLNHYGQSAQAEQYYYRVVGLTGTPYRGKGFDIVGENCYFKRQVGNISTTWLIDNHYLVEPYWGKPHQTTYDFQNLRVSQTGQFNKRELSESVQAQFRLTGNIMMEVASIVSSRQGAFIFASTRKHCQECFDALPPGEAAIIIGETPHEEREQIINDARSGKLKYLVNVNVLTVGVDVPNFDTVVFVRPTESLVLYTQAIGRGLRLNDDKHDCLVLDYAGNLDRHGNIDHPIINKALNDWAKEDEQYCIPCTECKTFNKPTTRRCIGIIKPEKGPKERCSKFFEWKNCHKCEAVNDRVSRECRVCKAELIDPNAKLEEVVSELETHHFKVLRAKFTYTDKFKEGDHRFLVAYNCIPTDASPMNFKTQQINEHFSFNTAEARKYFYYKFIKYHHPRPNSVYTNLHNLQYLLSEVRDPDLEWGVPTALDCVLFKGTMKIKKKYFDGDASFREAFSDRVVDVILGEVYGLGMVPNLEHKVAVIYTCYEDDIGYFEVGTAYSFVSPKARERFFNDYPCFPREWRSLPYKEIAPMVRSFRHADIRFPDKIVISSSRQYKGISGDVRWPFPYNMFKVLKEHCYDSWQIIKYNKDGYVHFILGAKFGKFHRLARISKELTRHEYSLLCEDKVKSVMISKHNNIIRMTEWILTDGTIYKFEEI